MTSGEYRKPLIARYEVVGRRTAPGVVPVGDFSYSVIELAPEAPSDKRGDRRIRTHLREAIIREAKGQSVAECRIHDRSRKGARLQLDRERPLPRRFLLKEGSTSQLFWATLVWQTGLEAGVKLTPAEDKLG